jgi:hypothetical protein
MLQDLSSFYCVIDSSKYACIENQRKNWVIMGGDRGARTALS